MKRKWLKRLLLTLALLPVLFLIAALLAPQFEARALREPLQAALSEQLGRPVTLREVRYTLFPSIGLSATDLVIPEDPAFGLEPFAYVTEMQAGIHWSSLFRRRLVLASLRLVEGSINLSRDDARGWNAGVLLRQVEDRMKSQRHAPSFSLRSGRINFRQGTLKSPFFLNTVDLDISPPSREGGSLRWSFEASPARTDRSEQGFGRFSGGGQWRPLADQPGIADVEIELERSAASEVAILLAGRDLGIQGRLGARVRLDGPPDNLKLLGRLELEGFDRGGRFGPRGKEWVLPFQGDLSLGRQQLELRTVEQGEEHDSPLTILMAVTSLYTRPEVEAAFTLNGIPAATFLDIARRLGAETPPGFSIEGTLHGAIALPRQGSLNGDVELRDAEVRLRSAGPVLIEKATVRLAAGTVELLPATLATPSSATAELAGRWAAPSGALSFQASFPSLPLDELNTALRDLPASAAPAPLQQCREGTLGGSLRYDTASGAADGVWVAALLLQNVLCEVPGVPGPVRLVRAPLTVKGPRWSFRKATLRWGKMDAIASADADPSSRRPLRLAMQTPELDSGQLEAVLRPAVDRPSSFLDRTLRRAARLPPWLAGRGLDLQLDARQFQLGGEAYERLRLHAFWDGTEIDIPWLELRRDAAHFQGRASVELRAGAPHYRLLGRVDRFPLAGASIAATVDLRAQGFGRDLLDQLRLAGRLDAYPLPAAGERPDWLAACYDYDASRPAPARLRLSCLEARDGAEYFTAGPVATSPDRISVELISPRRSLAFVWPPPL